LGRRRLSVACAAAIFVACAANRSWAQGAAGGEFQVNSYTTGDQGGYWGPPRVAGSAGGRFVVVWRSPGQDGAGGGVFGQRYLPSGVTEGPEFLVNAVTTTDDRRPSVGMRADGGFAVAWEDAGQGGPHGQDGSSTGVFGRLYGNTGLPNGPEFRINETTPQPQDQPAVSMASAGRFVVVWRSLTFNPFPTIVTNIFGRIYDSAGVPQTAEFLVNSTTGDLDNDPSVSTDADGDFVVVWARGGSGQSKGIYGRRYNSSGTAQGPEFLVNSFTSSAFIAEPSVSMDDNGAFVVVWSTNAGPGGSGWDVFGRRFDAAGTAQGADFLVNTDFIFSEQLRPDVALDANGGFVVAWASVCASCTIQDGTQRAILGRRYFANGAPLGPEFLVNTYTTGNQDNPSVAMTRSGQFVVAWDSNGQDGSGYGVFAQRYDDVIFQDGFES
jgi:hypothetical protein